MYLARKVRSLELVQARGHRDAAGDLLRSNTQPSGEDSTRRMNNHILRWLVPGIALFSLILLPFALYDEPITRFAEGFVETRQPSWLVGAGLAGLLASDILLPVPSSFVGTASGYLLGFWGGAFATWAGLSAGGLVGYWLGSRFGRSLTRRFVGDDELELAGRLWTTYGHWVLVVFRAVPVLAEATVLFAGTITMPLRRFLWLTALSNLGVALAYAGIGAYAVSTDSFLLAFGGSVALPALFMLLGRRSNSRDAAEP